MTREGNWRLSRVRVRRFGVFSLCVAGLLTLAACTGVEPAGPEPPAPAPAEAGPGKARGMTRRLSLTQRHRLNLPNQRSSPALMRRRWSSRSLGGAASRRLSKMAAGRITRRLRYPSSRYPSLRSRSTTRTRRLPSRLFCGLMIFRTGESTLGPAWPFWENPCLGGHPDLADVTISGESAGDVFVRDDSFGTFVEETDVVEWPKLEIVVSSALVLADEAQARAVYEQMSTIHDRCAIEDFSSGDLGGSISELSFSAFGEDTPALSGYGWSPTQRTKSGHPKTGHLSFQ